MYGATGFGLFPSEPNNPGAGRCFTVTVTPKERGVFPKTVVLDFGDGCQMNGKLRKGKIITVYSGPLHKPGNKAVTEFNGYQVDNRRISGRHVIENTTLPGSNQRQFTRTYETKVLNMETQVGRTLRAPTPAELADLMFAWQVCKYVKSNAIVYAREQRTIGVGAGQMSRVYSARIAGIKAADEGLEVAGSVMASDAFFPFRDGIDSAAGVGITAVIQPGGSVRDAEVIAAADEAGMAMVFTGMRHFRH
jgi:hypothetical protein